MDYIEIIFQAGSYRIAAFDSSGKIIGTFGRGYSDPNEAKNVMMEQWENIVIKFKGK